MMTNFHLEYIRHTSQLLKLDFHFRNKILFSSKNYHRSYFQGGHKADLTKKLKASR